MKIKICGLTSVEETEYLNRNDVDFAGMVLFYEKSKRNITIEKAKCIMARLSPKIKKVAVVVSPTLEQIKQIENAGFDFVQIHGALTENLIAQCSIPILKAFNIKDMDKHDDYDNCPKIAGYVFDAYEPGSGKTFDWNMLKDLPMGDKLFLLAGGLTAENVKSAIEYVKPDGVDVSTGVEYCDRLGKDPDKIDAFVASVRGKL